ncbi:trans-aconitate 2-methyltransferase [Spirillospora albida]|uniref:trans-aconitate 2-methyltransferase n=1 Tax=Spirillospora albida TaxID=58123 RepID=UPI0004C0BD60|nr:trans-aconitate 2-methyltransferase [Spirillospora albida]
MSRQAEPRWDPAQYGIFSAERARPFTDLVERIRAADPRRITDLGCGTGALTATLTERWPDAVIDAIDSAPEMIAKARAHEIPGRLAFRVADVTTWRPHQPVDLIVSNAVLHWIPGHPALLPHWAAALAPGGHLAFQVPGNQNAPSHTALRDLCESPRWRARLSGIGAQTVLEPAEYLDILHRHGCTVDTWETTYTQLLTGDDPVLAWAKGTALRPILTALDPAEAREFVDDYRDRLRAAYPPTDHGTVFPFRRVFVIARRKSP